MKLSLSFKHWKEETNTESIDEEALQKFFYWHELKNYKKYIKTLHQITEERKRATQR